LLLALFLIPTFLFSQATFPKFKEIALASGTTVTLSLAQYNEGILISGTATLSGNFVVNTSGTAYKGMYVNVYYYASATYSGGTVTILGTTLTQDQAVKRQAFKFIYSGSSWLAYQTFNMSADTVIHYMKLSSDIAGTGISMSNGLNVNVDTMQGLHFVSNKITSKLGKGLKISSGSVIVNANDTNITTNGGVLRIKNNSLDSTTVKHQSINNSDISTTRGYIKVGGAGNWLTDLNAKTSGYILAGDGTDLKSLQLHGDGSIDATGYLTITGSGSIDSTKITNKTISNSKLTATRGYIKVGQAGNWLGDLNAKTNGYILLGNGTDLISTAVTGVINISSAGLTTLNATIDPSMVTTQVNTESISVKIDSLEYDAIKILVPYKCTMTAIYLSVSGTSGEMVSFCVGDGAPFASQTTIFIPEGGSPTEYFLHPNQTFDSGDKIKVYRGGSAGRIMITFTMVKSL
jgi:hypothetical protein